MNLFGEIGRFILAVLIHWQAYMTGGIIMAILTSYEWLTHKTISRRTALIAMLAFFIVAFFMAWNDQYHASLAAEQRLQVLTTPQLEGSIDMVSASPSSEKGSALVVITAHIKNLGAPSIAEFSDCVFTTSSGKSAAGEFGPLPYAVAVNFGMPKPNDGHAAMIYSREENLLVKATASPIPTGGAVSGWLYVIVRGVDENAILQPGTVISIAVGDVRGKQTHLRYAITAANTHKSIPQDFP